MGRGKTSISSPRGTSGMFSFLLLGVFVILSLFLVLIGVQVYKGVTQSASINGEVRSTLSYLTNKVRAYDSEDGVRVEDQNGIGVLTLRQTIKDVKYVTYIYQKSGAIYEYFAEETDAFAPDKGEKILSVSDFSVIVDKEGMYVISLTGSDGKTHSVHIALKSGQR